MQAGTDLVLAMIDAANRTFLNLEPVYYYASANCSGAPLMYVDLLRFSYVNNGTMFYPAGAATSQAYGSSLENGFCSAMSGVATFAPMASVSVAQLQAPFTISR
jgi:hypothetical protein